MQKGKFYEHFWVGANILTVYGDLELPCIAGEKVPYERGILRGLYSLDYTHIWYTCYLHYQLYVDIYFLKIKPIMSEYQCIDLGHVYYIKSG